MTIAPDTSTRTAPRASSAALLAVYLEHLGSHSPVLRSVLERYGRSELGRYVAALASAPAGSTYQSRDDLLTEVAAHTGALLGSSTGEQAAIDLERLPVTLTANHHGVDYFAQSVQGTIAFALGSVGADPRVRTCTVLACGNVALNNLTYPRGLLAYRGRDDTALDRLPLKIPLFPDRFKREMVSTAHAYDATMVARCSARVGRLASEGIVDTSLAAAARRVLDEDYLAPEMLAETGYAAQATRLNHRLWQRMFPEPGSAPELVSIELELIVVALLRRDLASQDSLLAHLVLDPAGRASVLDALEGETGCWSRAALAERLDPARESPPGDATGTMFFWGIGEKGRRVPLIVVDVGGSPVLRGIGDHGEQVEIALDAPSLTAALTDGRIIPSLFTAYAAIALGRGMTCLGGYYQARYLPRMQTGVSAALRVVGDARGADAVAEARTHAYLSGMQMVSFEHRAGLVPAGPLEIVAAGGLDVEAIARLMHVSVADAHVASLLETMPDLLGPDDAHPGWREAIAAATRDEVGDRLIVI
ncbi:MAG: hypothetical protein H6983_10380 [Ectothiorhodospiraceae bacterium]|nr:hypothetical protein [Ectothiorhodospiraceae bacterium]